MIILIRLYDGSMGLNIFFTASTRDVIPTYRMMTDITIADRYSILPYPKGCLLSASLPASFVPTIVITEDPASDKLLTASTNIAMEFDFIPINILNIARTALPMMPNMLVFIILFSRSFSNWSSFLKSSNRFNLLTFYLLYNYHFCL